MQQQILFAGDTLNFSTTVTDYPANAGWTLNYRLVPYTASHPVIVLASIPATAPADHQVTVIASVTANWAADMYGWTSWVQNAGGEKYTVSCGVLTVRPDPRTITSGSFELSSFADGCC